MKNAEQARWRLVRGLRRGVRTMVRNILCAKSTKKGAETPRQNSTQCVLNRRRAVATTAPRGAPTKGIKKKTIGAVGIDPIGAAAFGGDP